MLPLVRTVICASKDILTNCTPKVCTKYMVMRVVKFSSGGRKLERFLTNNQHTQRQILNFENSVYAVGRCQKVPKFDFQRQFFKSKIIQIFFNFQNTNLGVHFLITSIFKSIHFLKFCPIFDTCPLTQFSKFNNL